MDAIRIGADSYLNRQLRTILPAIGLLTVALFFSVYIVRPSREALEEFRRTPNDHSNRTLPGVHCRASFSLIVGQLVCGWRSRPMYGSHRLPGVASTRLSRSPIIRAPSPGCSRMSRASGWYSHLHHFWRAAPDALLGFGFGGTLVALFMRVGGGSIPRRPTSAPTWSVKSKGYPEDDPRKRRSRCRSGGDNVGDCAGMAADIFESYEVTIVSALILGIALMTFDPTHSLKWIVYPLIIRGIGVISSILGTSQSRSGSISHSSSCVPTTLRKQCSAPTKYRASTRSSGPSSSRTFMPMTGAWRPLQQLVWSGSGFQPIDLVFHFSHKETCARDRRFYRDRSSHNNPIWPGGRDGVQCMGASDDRNLFHLQRSSLSFRWRIVCPLRSRDGWHWYAQPHR